MKSCTTSSTQNPASAQSKPEPQCKPFVSQHDIVQALVLLEQESAARESLEPRAFDNQFCEIDDLLDARNKLADVETLAVGDVALIQDNHSGSSNDRRFSRSSNPFACSPSSSTTIQAVASSGFPSKTMRSGSSTVFNNVLAEDGRPYANVMERWLRNVKPTAGSEARLTRRGVDCRINAHGKVCEWVIFL